MNLKDGQKVLVEGTVERETVDGRDEWWVKVGGDDYEVYVFIEQNGVRIFKGALVVETRIFKGALVVET